MLDPVIKVRQKYQATKIRIASKMSSLTSMLVIIAIPLFGNIQVTDAILCDKSPEKSVTVMPKTSGDNGFAVGILGSPQLYRPGQQYTITLEGTINEDGKKPRFSNFLLAAEPVSNSPDYFTPMGTMQIVPNDPMVMYSQSCRNSIKESSSSVKEKVEVYWTAPSVLEMERVPQEASACIEFRAMVIERQDVWYMNDNGLTYRLCKDTSFVNPNGEIEIIPPCGACNEAKYELIFEGIWSRHTHPKDFPEDEWRTEFSKLIGASHSNGNYSLWKYGKFASVPLEVLAKHGMTRRLEAQMKQFSRDIRSVIKARGLQQRSNVAGQTFAVFRVDPIHHLLSFATKMIPSPDWFVGVANQNLCLANNSWTDHRVIDLVLNDAGVDSGMTYNAPPQVGQHRDTIQQITSSNPDDPQSPFWDENKAPMKPVARLHIIKQREYRKRCRQGQGGRRGPNYQPNPSWSSGQQGGAVEDNNAFVAHQGTGIGPMQNGESYDDGNRGNVYQGNISPVSDYQEYDNEERYKQNPPPLRADDPCMTTDWGVWSACSQTCGSAGNSQSRRRQFMNRRKANQNDCVKSSLLEKQPCRHLAECPTKDYGRSFNPFQVDDNKDEFQGYTTNWGRRGLESGSKRIVPPGGSQSYIYESGSGGDMQRNRNGMYGGVPNRNQYNAHSGRNSPNIGNGMYGYGKNNWGSDQYGRQRVSQYENQYPRSYSYGADNGNPQADDVSHDLPEQLPYQGLPQGDGSSSYVEKNCEVSSWGEWSECSSICDNGSRTRMRDYTTPEESGACERELRQDIPCVGNGVDCPGRGPSYVHSGFGFNMNTNMNANMDAWRSNGQDVQEAQYPERTSDDCATAEWSDWSPCSSKCSDGRQKRTRLYTKPFVDGPRSCDVQLIESKMCWGDSGGSFCRENYITSQNDNSYSNDQDYIHSGVEIQPLENEDQLSANHPMNQIDRCSLELNEGAKCVSNLIRWYYDGEGGTCKEFVYKGCGGNQNNFKTKELCLSTCNSEEEEEVYGVVRESEDPEEATHRPLEYNGSNAGLVSGSLIRLTPEEEKSGVFSPPRIGRPPNPIDCQASSWSEWSDCSKTCGIGWTTRTREILVDGGTGGRACPKKLHRKRKCRLMPCPADTKYWYQGSWRHMAD